MYSCNYVIGNNQTKDESIPISLLKSDSVPSSTGKNDYKCKFYSVVALK